jgi:tRNA (guanine37-N1)-methyltransferase
MRVHILTLFPEYFESPLRAGLMGRAVDGDILQVVVHDLRAWTHDRHGTADDYAFGGGPGMVLKPEPFFEALDELRAAGLDGAAPVVLTSPQGRLFDQASARELAATGEWVVLCGRYRGVDERVREALVTHEYSVGDVILNGGEAAALTIVEAAARLLPGAIGDPASAAADSFAESLLDHPHYTRPAEYRGLRVPEVLLSGHHAEIERWRRRQALERTLRRRPDLLEKASLDEADRACLDRLRTAQAEGTEGTGEVK